MAKRKKQPSWYTVKSVPTMAIKPFAKQHGFQLSVVEREMRTRDRYFAYFVGVEEKGNGVLIGTHGNGATIDAAIHDYANKISLKVLVSHAYSPYRREVRAPKLYHTIQGRK